MPVAMDEWVRFLTHTLKRRLSLNKFEQFAKALYIKAPLAPHLVADLLLRPSKSQSYDLDPQVPLYVQVLLRNDILDLPCVLHALLRYSTFRPVDTTKEEHGDANSSHARWTNSYPHEEGLMYGLSKVVAAGARPKSAHE